MSDNAQKVELNRKPQTECQPTPAGTSKQAKVCDDGELGREIRFPEQQS